MDGPEFTGIAAEGITAGDAVTGRVDPKTGQLIVWRRPNTTATHPRKPDWRAPDPFNSDDCLIRQSEPAVKRAADLSESRFEEFPGFHSEGWSNAGWIYEFEPPTYAGDDASYRYGSPIRDFRETVTIEFLRLNHDILDRLFGLIIHPEYDCDHAIHPYID